MRRLLLAALTVFVVIYIFGCATTSLNKKSIEKADTLLIGQIELNATGFHRYGDATVNGTHRANIEIHLQSMKTDKTVIIRSKRPNGYFFVVNPKEDHYRISRLFFKKKVGGAWASVWTSPSSSTRVMVVTGWVNNLGTIKWNAD